MAKAQQNQGTEYVALPKGALSGDFQGEPVSDEELAFDEFIAGMSAERMGELRVGKIKVEKDGTPIANSKGAHCFACPIDQFSYSGLLEHIRRRHGAGLYRVVGVEQGKRGLAFNRLIEIAEELAREDKPESPLQNPANMLESVGKIMAESAARTEALIARLSETRAAPVDPMDSMAKMAALFSTMMGSVSGMFKQQPAGGGTGDLLGQLETLVKLKELFGATGGGGDSDKESNFFDVVKAGLQSFGPALATLAVRGAQTPAPQLPAPAQPPIGTDPRSFAPQPFAPQPQPQPAAAPGSDEMASLKRQVDALVQNAKNGVDPGVLANTILDLTPDEKLDDLGDMLEAPDMIEKMASLNPEVQNYRDFFEKLRKALLDLLGEPAADTLAPNAGQSAGPQGPTGAATA